MLTKSHRKLITILFILQILVVVRNMESGFFSFLWYCDFAPGLLMIAFLMSNVQAVKGILNVGFFAQIAYTIDLLHNPTRVIPDLIRNPVLVLIDTGYLLSQV